MNVNIFTTCLVLCLLLLIACGDSKQTAQSVAQKWCDLNARVHKAPDGGPEYGKAKAALKNYERDMEAKYEKDETFMKEIENEIERCEAASEGR